MIRTQIQLTPKQARALKRLAAKEGVSMAELIRQSVDTLLQTSDLPGQDALRARALATAGRFTGPSDLAADHDAYLAKSFEA